MTERLRDRASRPSEPRPETVRRRYARVVESGTSLERVNAFSDAVFAIAMTILVLELHVPQVEPAQLPAALLRLVPGYLTFVLSFVVIGMIWLSHHRKFGLIRRSDPTLLRLNLLLLLLVASLALPTALLDEYGDETISAIIYASAICAIGYLMVLIWLFAWRRGLVDPRVDTAVHRLIVAQALIVPTAFLVSIPVALLWGATAGEITWALAVPAFLLLRLTHGRAPRAPERTRP